MNRKTADNRSKLKPLSEKRKEAILKAALWVLVCLWMFVLGILVGRGTAPVRFDIKRLQDELASLKAVAVKQTTERYRIAFQEVDKQVDLGFHEALTDSKSDLTSVALSTPEQGGRAGTAETDVSSEKVQSDVPKKTKNPEFQKKSAADTRGSWIIQVAATQDKSKGNQMVNNLRELGFQANLVRAEVPDKGTWYRIRVGAYTSRAAVDTDLQQLKKKGFSPMIVTP